MSVSIKKNKKITNIKIIFFINQFEIPNDVTKIVFNVEITSNIFTLNSPYHRTFLKHKMTPGTESLNLSSVKPD